MKIPEGYSEFVPVSGRQRMPVEVSMTRSILTFRGIGGQLRKIKRPRVSFFYNESNGSAIFRFGKDSGTLGRFGKGGVYYYELKTIRKYFRDKLAMTGSWTNPKVSSDKNEVFVQLDGFFSRKKAMEKEKPKRLDEIL